MRRSYPTLAILALAVLGLAGCQGNTDKSEGGVRLSISDFDGLPVQTSVNAAAALGSVSVGTINVQNVPLEPGGITSDLMNVEIQSYEVVYTRGDRGTRVPNPLVRGIFGVAPVGGTFTVNNLPVLSLEQLLNPPLSELGRTGVDSETGADTILLNLRLRFFGRTLSGDAVQSSAANFTIEFVP